MRTTRRYLGCCTRRNTSTTMVFSILALVTRPVRIWCSWRVSAAASGAVLFVSVLIAPSSGHATSSMSWPDAPPLRPRLGGKFLRAQQCFYPRQIFAGFAKPLQRFGFLEGQLNPQEENLFPTRCP